MVNKKFNKLHLIWIVPLSLFALMIVLGVIGIMMFGGSNTPEVEYNTNNEKLDESIDTSSFSDDSWISLLEINFNSYDLYDVDIRIAEGRVNGGDKAVLIGYRSTAQDEVELAGEMGLIAGTFLGAAKQGWDIDALVVIIGDSNGITTGMWHITQEWKDDYLTGKLTMEQISLKAFSSMEVF